MRAFFAIEPDAETALAIERWRALCWPSLIGGVPVANLHLTLAFLGQIDSQQLQALESKASTLHVNAFELTLDQLVFWPKPGILLLQPSCVPEVLPELASKLSGFAAQQGIASQHRSFKPHLTMKRRMRDAPASPLIEPSFEFTVSEFHLMESIRQDRGVHYESRRQWALNTLTE